MTVRQKLIWIAVAIGVPAACYSLDAISVVTGVPARPRYSTITISRFYRVNEKFNKFSLNPLPPVEERCVNALFPHFGSNPCWYVSRHTMQSIAVN